MAKELLQLSLCPSKVIFKTLRVPLTQFADDILEAGNRCLLMPSRKTLLQSFNDGVERFRTGIFKCIRDRIITFCPFFSIIQQQKIDRPQEEVCQNFVGHRISIWFKVSFRFSQSLRCSSNFGTRKFSCEPIFWCPGRWIHCGAQTILRGRPIDIIRLWFCHFGCAFFIFFVFKFFFSFLKREVMSNVKDNDAL